MREATMQTTGTPCGDLIRNPYIRAIRVQNGGHTQPLHKQENGKCRNYEHKVRTDARNTEAELHGSQTSAGIALVPSGTQLRA